MYCSKIKFLIAFFFSITTLSVYATDASDPNLLHAYGEATISKPADQVMISLAITTQHEVAEKALGQNNKKMAALLKVLDSLGLTKNDIETSYFNVFPVYSERPRDATEDWRAKIVSYRVTHSLKVTLSWNEHLGKILDQIIEGGANQIDSITFSLKDPNIYRKEAIQLATFQALYEAQILAEAANINLDKIHSITLQDTDLILPRIGQESFSAYRTASVPIESGQVTLRAKVSISYFINH